jgi:membrane protein required for colicin V production
MNFIDVALVVLLLLCALRGFWRGFFRESFGFLGLIVGLGGALRFSDLGAAALAPYLPLPSSALVGIAFVGIFMVAYTSLNLFGLLFESLLGSLMLKRANQLAGVAFAVAKGGAILALVLLFFHLFRVVPALDQRIMESRVARPMVAAAESVIHAGLRTVTQPAEPAEA